MEEIKLVEVENLSYWYPGSSEPALSEVNLEFYYGEFVLVLGLTGSGKSTLCRAINGLVPHFYGGRIKGHVRVKGRSNLERAVGEIAREVGLVFQDPETQIFLEDPELEVAFGLENLGIDFNVSRKRVVEALSSLGLGTIRGRRTSELSGGEKQKLALASVLSMQPEVLVLDEPTSQLDPVSAEDFLSTLKSLNEELGITVILAEHRVERCFHLADRVVVLERGTVAFSGSKTKMLDWRRKGNLIPLPPIAKLFMEFFDDGCPLTVKEGRAKLSSLEGSRLLKTRTEQEVRAEEPDALEPGSRHLRKQPDVSSGAVIVAEDLWYSYGDGTLALRNVDLCIGKGECIGVIGENGSGKTTLAKHFNALLKPSKGRVLLNGEDTRMMKTRDAFRVCSMVFQNPEAQLISKDVESELKLSLRASAAGRDGEDERVDQILSELGIAHLRGRRIDELSCGEKELIAIASVAVVGAPVLILDEPTRGLDPEAKNNLAEFLRKYNERGGTLVLITHDLEFIAEITKRVVMLSDGRIVADGDMREMLSGSIFYTTHYNRCFRGFKEGVVTRGDAFDALKEMV